MVDFEDINKPFEGTLEAAEAHRERVEGLAERAVELLGTEESNYQGRLELTTSDGGIISIAPERGAARLNRSGYRILRTDGIDVAWIHANHRGLMLGLEPTEYLYGE